MVWGHSRLLTTQSEAPWLRARTKCPPAGSSPQSLLSLGKEDYLFDLRSTMLLGENDLLSLDSIDDERHLHTAWFDRAQEGTRS